MTRKKVLVANVRGPQGIQGPPGPVGDVTPEANRLAEEMRTIYRNVQFTSDAFDYKVTQVTQDLDNKSAQEQQKLANTGGTIADNLETLGTQYAEQAEISSTNAKTSETNAKTSEINAKQSETNAKASADSIGGLVDAFKIDTSKQGRVITATDSADSVINGLKVFGESTQVQSTGINLFNQEDLLNTDSPNYDKSQGGSGLWFFKVQVKGPVVVSIATTTTTTSLYLAVSNTPNISGVVGWLVHKSSANKNGYVVVNSPQENTIWLGVNNNLTSIKQMLEACEGIMICDGTVAKPFEPYTGLKPSPSPEYPEEIVSKTINEISVSGKNILDFDKWLTDCSVDFTKEDSSYVLRNVTNLHRNPYVFSEEDIDITLSAKIESASVNSRIRFELLNKSDKVLGLLNSGTLKAKCSKIRINYNNFSITRIIKPQIELGSLSTEYEPYKQPQTVSLTQPITLNGIPTDSGGNVTIDGKQYISDVIAEKDGVYGIERYCYKVTANINASDIKPYDTKKGFYISNVLHESSDCIEGYANNLIVCFSYTTKPNGVWIGAKSTFIYLVNSTFYDESAEDKGLQKFKDWLAKNPIEIVTYKSTPTFEPLPEADQQAIKALKSNYPTTVVTNNDSAFMQLDYVADTKNYIDNRLSEIKTAIIASKGV